MSAQHTPGPWQAGTVALKDGHISVFSGDCGVAKVWDQEAGGRAQHTANARLIAAAPDLFLALRGAVEALAMCEPRTRHGADCQRTASLAALAAIARAEGRA